MGIQRLLSLFLLATALYFLGQDVANLINGIGGGPQSLDAVWNRLDAASLHDFETFLIGQAWPGIWDPGMTTLLRMPAWAVPLALGLLMLGADVFAQRRGR